MTTEKQAPAPDNFTPLTDFERKIQQRILGQDLANIPSEFWAAVKKQMEQDGPRLLVADLPGIKGEEWREVGAAGQPAFANNWVNFNSATHATAAFHKDALGNVHIKGLVKDGTITAAAFTLPEGYLPPLIVHFPANSNHAFGSLFVDTNGLVTPQAGSNAFFSINVSFRAS